MTRRDKIGQLLHVFDSLTCGLQRAAECTVGFICVIDLECHEFTKSKRSYLTNFHKIFKGTGKYSVF